MNVPLCHKMCLDSTGNAGPSSEVTQPVAVGTNNAVQLEVIMYAFTATTAGFLLQESNDLENWTDKGSVRTTNHIGRTLLTSDTSVTATHIRYKCSINTGTGKAVFAASVNLSDQ